MSMVVRPADAPEGSREDYRRHAVLTAGRSGGASRSRQHIRRLDLEVCEIDVLARGRAVVAQDGRATPSWVVHVHLQRRSALLAAVPCRPGRLVSCLRARPCPTLHGRAQVAAPRLCHHRAGDDPAPAGQRADLEGGHMRRTIQVLGIALMVAGLFIDRSARSRRRAGATADRDLTSRLPLLLFWIGAVVLVLASI